MVGRCRLQPPCLLLIVDTFIYYQREVPVPNEQNQLFFSCLRLILLRVLGGPNDWRPFFGLVSFMPSSGRRLKWLVDVGFSACLRKEGGGTTTAVN